MGLHQGIGDVDLDHGGPQKRHEKGSGITDTPRSPFAGHHHRTGGIMGDKGGKKDKEKGQKQKAEKQVVKAKVKQEKDPKKKI